ncbi:MAG: hypothetical protein IT450_24305, partial [Phycisphaerales bacterium]|nr:hypothetical protein [Phycisphaerales bacterium]
MAAPSREQAQRALRDFAYRAQHSKTRRAVLGGIDPATGAQVLNAPGRPGWVIVRVLEGDTVTQTVALNSRVKSVYGLLVWVGENQEGLLSVLGGREGELTNQLGKSAQAVMIPDVVTVGLITERRFEPG